MSAPNNNDKKPNTREKDQITGVETTGHEWDGIKELNNPAPRWWLWVFFITCIWAFGYWVVYPSWPTLSGHTKGIKGWTQYGELKESQGEILTRKDKYLRQIATASVEEIQKDKELYTFALAAGASAFKDNCATCHGSGGAGGKGYPNLNDDDWLWGGTLEEIYTTLKHGIRSAHDETRMSQMPAFGKDGILKQTEIAEVADYVRSLSDPKIRATAKGEQIFKENCVACHGEDGKGNKEMGAPNLADAIWLYGGDKATIMDTIIYSRYGMMPNWDERLDDATLKELAVYVHSLGGGK
jgi:cytochrome c oxidase cbb3-type subunit 3